MKFYCYTDGSFSRKYQKGAYAFLISVDEDLTETITGADKVPNSTSQISELTAVQKCLQKLVDIYGNRCKNHDLIITSDSSYCVNGLNEWIDNWIAKGWKTYDRKPVANKELWESVYELKQCFKSVEMKWCKGHIGVKGNEIVDKLCFNLTREDS